MYKCNRIEYFSLNNLDFSLLHDPLLNELGYLWSKRLDQLRVGKWEIWVLWNLDGLLVELLVRFIDVAISLQVVRWKADCQQHKNGLNEIFRVKHSSLAPWQFLLHEFMYVLSSVLTGEVRHQADIPHGRLEVLEVGNAGQVLCRWCFWWVLGQDLLLDNSYELLVSKQECLDV